VNGRIAGWSEYVQPYKEKSMFWHTLWVNCGRPRSGAVADCMRRTRAAYHYAIRGVKKDGGLKSRTFEVTDMAELELLMA